MTVALRSAASTTAFPSTGTSYPTTLPTGLAAGDLLVGWANSDTDGQTISIPSSTSGAWTQPTGAPVAIGNGRLYCWWKFLVTGDAEIGGASKTLTISAAGGSMIVAYQAFTGAGTPELFAVASGSNAGGPFTSLAPAGTPGGANRMCAFAFAGTDGGTTDWTTSEVGSPVSTGLVEDLDVAASGHHRCMAVGHLPLGASVAPQTITGTYQFSIGHGEAGVLFIPPAGATPTIPPLAKFLDSMRRMLQ